MVSVRRERIYSRHFAKSKSSTSKRSQMVTVSMNGTKHKEVMLISWSSLPMGLKLMRYESDVIRGRGSDHEL